MRNHIPTALDLAIVIFAWGVVGVRLLYMRSTEARWFTLLLGCFATADLIKVGLINDLLTTAFDARAVRVAAQIFTVAAAFVAAAAVRDARTAWAGRPRNVAGRALVPIGLAWIATAATLGTLDFLAGDRDSPIEAAAAEWSVGYFAVYAGTILCADGYALASVVVAFKSHSAHERPPIAISMTAFAIFVTTGLNAVSLLWYAVASALGRVGAAERLQRDTNGNVFAYFTLAMATLALIGLLNWTAQRRDRETELASSMRGLPVLWKQLTDRAPSVRLGSPGGLQRDEAVVRMITECIDALVVLSPSSDEERQVTSPSEILRRARELDPARHARPALGVADFPAPR